MNDHPFIQFISLVNLDQKIQSFVNKRTSIDNLIVEINKQKNNLLAFSEEASKKIFTLKKNVDGQELEMKALDQKENEKKKKLDTLVDYKECQAIKNELDSIQRLQVAQEKLVLDAWNELESAQSALVKRQVDFKGELKELDDELQRLEKENVVYAQELNSLALEREEKKIGVPEEWLSKYGEMGQRVADPVVAIEQQSCGGCYQQITLQDFIRAKRGALLQCKKCFRLLYFSE